MRSAMEALAMLAERGWFHREGVKLRARRLPKGDMERKALARIGRNILARWRPLVRPPRYFAPDGTEVPAAEAEALPGGWHAHGIEKV